MRILQLCSKSPYPAVDGGTIAALDITRGLLQAGHRVDILSMTTERHPGPQGPLPAPLNQAGFFSCYVDNKLSPVGLLRNLCFSRRPYNAVRYESAEFRRLLQERLQDQSYDLVLLEGLYVTPYIDTIRLFPEVAIALRAHNVEHEIWKRIIDRQKNILKRLYLANMQERLKQLELETLDRYDLLIPITAGDGEKFTALGNTRPMHICPTGFDFSRLPALTGDNPTAPGLFHLGSLDWIPNREGLIWFMDHVWPDLRRDNPDLQFTIAGRNAPPGFGAICQRQGVRFLGAIDDAHDFIRRQGIMIVPLFSGSGMRIKIIEGMALGKPIVATPVGAEGIPVTNGHDILIAEDGTAFRAAINRLLREKRLRADLGHNAREFIRENFDTHRIGRDLSDFFRTRRPATMGMHS